MSDMAVIADATADDTTDHQEFSAQADGGTAVEQVRSALNRLAEQLRAGGFRSADLRTMSWIAAHPASFHPSRHDIDLAYREVFGGFRPPIALRAGNGPLTIHASASLPHYDSEEPVWHHYNLRELERQMSPRSAAVSMEAVFREKREKGTAFRALHPNAAYDIAYGNELSDTFDLFYPSHGTSHPLWVFIHGGYWQASDKRDVHDLATQMLAAGHAVAMPNYALCPPSTLRRVVDQVRRCLLFIHEEAESLGIDASRFNIAGTSAGGHLAAVMTCDPELPFIRSSLIISGIHDLRPVSMLPTGRIVGLERRDIAALSPALLKPNRYVRIGIAVGELESDEFRRQSSELAQNWNGQFLLVQGRRHFDVTTDLASGGPLADLAISLAGATS